MPETNVSALQGFPRYRVEPVVFHRAGCRYCLCPSPIRAGNARFELHYRCCGFDGELRWLSRGWFLASLCFDVTRLLGSTPGPTNHTIAIRVKDTGHGYYPQPLHCAGHPAGECINRFNYGGIVRNLSIEVCPMMHIARVNVRETGD